MCGIFSKLKAGADHLCLSPFLMAFTNSLYHASARLFRHQNLQRVDQTHQLIQSVSYSPSNRTFYLCFSTATTARNPALTLLRLILKSPSSLVLLAFSSCVEFLLSDGRRLAPTYRLARFCKT